MEARDSFGKMTMFPEAIRYVVYGQGDPMDPYLAEALL
jgi:hypothetical protein